MEGKSRQKSRFSGIEEGKRREGEREEEKYVIASPDSIAFIAHLPVPGDGSSASSWGKKGGEVGRET